MHERSAKRVPPQKKINANTPSSNEVSQKRANHNVLRIKIKRIIEWQNLTDRRVWWTFDGGQHLSGE